MGRGVLRVGPGELGARLRLNPMNIWLCLGLGRPGLGGRRSGLWSVLRLGLVLQWRPCLGLRLCLMPGLQVSWSLGWGSGLGLRWSLGWGRGLHLGKRSVLQLILKFGWGPGLGLELRLQ